MSIALHGMGVSRGIAIGKIHIIQRDQPDIHEYKITEKQVDDEIRRFQSAIECASKQLKAIRKHIPGATDTDIAAFIDTHLLMLEDAALTQEPIRLIREEKINAEWALKQQRDALVHVFDEMNDAYLRTRKDDVDYVVNRIQRFLSNRTPLPHEEPDGSEHLFGYIVVANDLTPADTVLMQHNGISGFLTEYGGPTSHTAILARSLAIPAIVGVQHALSYLHEDDYVILDGTRGVLVVDPDRRTLDQYQKLQRKEKRYYADLKKLKGKPAVTLDNTVIDLMANIELPADFDTVKEVGANGVGLYRTEFLYMNRDEPPDEDEHYDTYTKVIDILGGLPLTIRTLDLGADKQVDGGRQEGPVASNPALGLRAIRLCLKEPSLFRPQIRAILRASVHGPVRVMIPMLSNIHELSQILQIVNEMKSELEEKDIPFDRDIQLGGMIEVPAAAVCAESFARHLDFLSIGTNDLIQYTMAIDRVNDEVNYLYDPLHPAVLRLIHGTIQAGERTNTPVSMCGEMAGETQYTRLLLAMGLREFSVHPTVLLEIKQIITQTDLDKLSHLSKRVLKAENSFQVAGLLSEVDKSITN